MATSDIIVVERFLLKSKAFRSLSGTAKTVYFDFCMKCRVKSAARKPGKKRQRVILNNGEIEYTYSEAEKKKPKINRSAFMRALDGLIERGFIDVAHSGSGGKKGDKSKYAISERWRKWGGADFKKAIRPKDTRSGRGFKSGDAHWKKKVKAAGKAPIKAIKRRINKGKAKEKAGLYNPEFQATLKAEQEAASKA